MNTYLSVSDVAKFVLIIFVTAIFYVIYSHVFLSVQRKGEAPVRWSWIPLMGYAIEMGTRPIELLKESSDLMGEVFGIVVAGNRMFFISDCHSFNVILKPIKELSWEEFHHSILTDFFGAQKKTLMKHIVNDDLMRKWFSQYLYSDVSLHALTRRMQKQLLKSTGALSSSNAVQLSDFLSRLIFQASVATLFNEDAANDKDLYSAFVTFDQQLPLAAAGISVSNFSGAKKAREVLINACKKYTSDNCELICKRREYFQEVGLPVQDAAAFTLAMLWASVGNTMPVTFWLVFYLLSDTALLSRAKEEVHSAALESVGQELSQEQLNGMVYIDACITETLRLTSGSLIMRFVKKQCDLTMASGATYRFRKDDRVGLCPALTHLDEEIYPDAKSFRPDRWLNGDTLEERQMSSVGRIPCFKGGKAITNNAAFLPFGGGSTLCPGRRFARNEVKTLVAFLLTHLDLELCKPNGVDQPQPAFDNSRAGLGIFPPKGDVQVHLTVLK